MCEMDALSVSDVAEMARSMTAEKIASYYTGKGIPVEVVTDGIYEVGLRSEGRTIFVPALQPKRVPSVNTPK
jgi:hypothetical protein